MSQFNRGDELCLSCGTDNQEKVTVKEVIQKKEDYVERVVEYYSSVSIITEPEIKNDHTGGSIEVSRPSKSNLGMIIGGSVGGVVLIILIIYFVYFRK